MPLLILYHLSILRGSNFLLCFATVQILVYEYMKNGNLGEHISSKDYCLCNNELSYSLVSPLKCWEGFLNH